MSGRVAILGAGGFVGARLLEMAVHGGRTDIVPVVRAFRSVARVANLGMQYRLGDASRADSLETAFAGCEAVVNLTMGDPADILRNTESIYTAAVAAGARLLVHLSSATVYGQVERPDLPDDAPPQLDHWMPYAREKGRAENWLRERMADARLAIVVLRPGLIWGPRSPWVLGPAAELVRGAAYLVGDGGGVCNLMYVDNLVRSIDAVVAHPAPVSGFYNVADDETTTWREYYAALAAGLGVNAAKIHTVPGDRYRAGADGFVEQLKQLAPYRWLKNRLPQETKAAIKLHLKRALASDRPAQPGAGAKPAVTRDMWQLQTTRHPLPNARFQAVFGHQNPISFASGLAASLAWLRFIGLDGPGADAVRQEKPGGSLQALIAKGLRYALPAPAYWRVLAWRIGYFDPELRLLHYLCDRTRVSIDVGASIGSYTVHLLNHSRKCYAFEPRPDAAAYLARRLAAGSNSRLRVESVALSDHAGRAQLRVPVGEAGRSSVERANPLEQLGAVEVLTVPVRRLDDYDDIGPVGCIKIDVEGHEDAVLRGARRLLLRDRPSLIIEIEERHKRHAVGTVSGFLGELGYRGFFFRHERLNPIEAFRVEEHQDVSNLAGGGGNYVNNFLFAPQESLAKLRHLMEGPSR
jgi:FkbM family methyltransferase